MAGTLAAISGGGGFQQQDANEFWVELVKTLQRVTITDSNLANKKVCLYVFIGKNIYPSIGTQGGWNPIDRYFTGHIKCKLTCEEDESDTTEILETFSQMSCFINKEVKYLHTGIRNGLESQLTKRSEKLGRDATYKKIGKISRLPAYLPIQFVRFFYKEKEQVNAKILKEVIFPMQLDLYEFCTPELQNKLKPQREKATEEEDRLEEEAVKNRKPGRPKETVKKPDPYENPDLYDNFWLDDDLGSNNTGYYELQAVLTHQGRSSSSGHYVGWAKRKSNWIKFDDHLVSAATEEEILRLKGGGDWHCAYVLLYGPRRVLKHEKTVDGDKVPDVNANTCPMETN